MKVLVRLNGQYKTWYVRSTGEIVGPNYGATLGRANSARLLLGNLFGSELDAIRAAEKIREALR